MIVAHSFGSAMGAMGGRALTPVFLRPLQCGVANLGRVYSMYPYIHVRPKSNGSIDIDAQFGSDFYSLVNTAESDVLCVRIQ